MPLSEQAKEKRKETIKRWGKEHPEKLREYSRRWRRKNPEVGALIGF